MKKNVRKVQRRASRRAAPRGWAFDLAAKIVEELFALGDEPNSPTHRIEFKGGIYTTDKSQERAQGGMCRVAMIDWLARALEQHVPNIVLTNRSTNTQPLCAKDNLSKTRK